MLEKSLCYDCNKVVDKDHFFCETHTKERIGKFCGYCNVYTTFYDDEETTSVWGIEGRSGRWGATTLRHQPPKCVLCNRNGMENISGVFSFLWYYLFGWIALFAMENAFGAPGVLLGLIIFLIFYYLYDKKLDKKIQASVIERSKMKQNHRFGKYLSKNERQSHLKFVNDYLKPTILEYENTNSSRVNIPSINKTKSEIIDFCTYLGINTDDLTKKKMINLISSYNKMILYLNNMKFILSHEHLLFLVNNGNSLIELKMNELEDMCSKNKISVKLTGMKKLKLILSLIEKTSVKKLDNKHLIIIEEINSLIKKHELIQSK